MFVVDTNVLVDAANSGSPFHEPCRTLLEEARRRSGAWYATWGIAWEFLRVTSHPKVLARPIAPTAALRFLEALAASPGFAMLVETPRHAAVAAEVLGDHPELRGSVLHDLHTAVLMKEHGIRRIVTRDLDFHRFPFLEVVDPLRPGRR